ncbi:MAG TPA: hypothetical protein VE154_05380 [Chthoniobacterales bacterium]|nr:hypothetical protein [Chthoniobacterales bacterium]
MTRLILAALCIATFTLTGCDNRTRDAVRWGQIANAQRANKDIQPWSEAVYRWGNAERETGTVW